MGIEYIQRRFWEKVFLFWQGTQHYPSWLSNGNDFHVWPTVNAAMKKETDKWERYALTLNDGNSFEFVEIFTTDIDGGGPVLRCIELYYNDKIVATVNAILDGVRLDYSYVGSKFLKGGEWKLYIAKFLKWKKENDKIMQRKWDERFARNRSIQKMEKGLDE